MEKKHKILVLMFGLITAISFAGFYRTYFSYFPDLGRFSITIHLHFLGFSCWFLFVILQPVLIAKRRYRLHHKLGRVSYFLAPVLVMTILLLTRDKILRDIAEPESNASMTAFIGLMDAFSFSACYLTAMIKRHDLRWHVAFIIGATLIALNPGMARLLNNVGQGLGLLGAVIVPFIVPTAILIFEKLKFSHPILKSPYFAFLGLWTFVISMFIAVPSTELWHSIFAKIVKML